MGKGKNLYRERNTNRIAVIVSKDKNKIKVRYPSSNEYVWCLKEDFNTFYERIKFR